jgi:hypothetical protein
MLALDAIKENDTRYQIRYRLVFEAVELALVLGYDAGVAIDPKDPSWPVAYIELPTGQVSWRMPQHPHPWDGHTTAEKYRRLRAYTKNRGAPFPERSS